MQAFQKITSEPLAQFLIIGLALFAVDRLFSPDEADPRSIVIGDEVYTRLANVFDEARGRLPTEEEMAPLVERFLVNETLYREALALDLDHGDEMMRERLAQRMRLILYSGITVEEPSDEILRAWLAERPGLYDAPATISFQIIGLDGTEEEARAEAARAAAREATEAVVKPAGIRMLTMMERPRNQLVAMFEEFFVAGMEAAPLGEWTAVESSRGWQIVKLIETRPAVKATFDAIRGQAATDWKEEQLQREARESLAALRATYDVETEPYDPDGIARFAADATN